MGSCILSRSFVVEKWEPDEDEEAINVVDTSLGSAMDVDEQDENQETTDHTEGAENGDEENEEEDSSDIAMVPMADMLNARYQTENVSESP